MPCKHIGEWSLCDKERVSNCPDQHLCYKMELDYQDRLALLSEKEQGELYAEEGSINYIGEDDQL